MYTTSETDEYALPNERLLRNHGWLTTKKFRKNETYKASEGEVSAVASGCIDHPRILALRAFDAIFSDNKKAPVQLNNGVTVVVRRRFKNDLRCIETENYLFVEQNPWKHGSKNALLAQHGAMIMWVIRKKDHKYIARVDGRGIKKL